MNHSNNVFLALSVPALGQYLHLLNDQLYKKKTTAKFI